MKNFHRNINIKEGKRTISDIGALIEKSDKNNIITEVGFYQWGNNVIKHSDGLYYSFIERWDDTDGFTGWIHYIKIYVSEGNTNPLGGFTGYTEITTLRTQSWSSGMVGNPHIVYHNNLYYLFYIGSTWNNISYPLVNSEARANQRIGLATSNHPKGEWIPEVSNPIIDVRPEKWDSTLIVNPYVWRDINGLWRCYYKADKDGVLGDFEHGVATSTDLVNWERTDNNFFGGQVFRDIKTEDVAVWKENDKWYAMTTDITGEIVDPAQGLWFVSNDGITFYLADNQPSWTTQINYTDNTTASFHREERPFLLVENNKAIAFGSAMWDGNNLSQNVIRNLKFK